MSHTSPKDLSPNAPGCAPLEKLPNEILHHILGHLATPDTTLISHEISGNLPKLNPNPEVETTTLFPCLLTSRRFYDVALPLASRCLKIESARKVAYVLMTKSDHRSSIRSAGLPTSSVNTLVKSSLSLATRITRLSIQLQFIDNFTSARKIFFGFESLQSIEVFQNINGTCHNHFFNSYSHYDRPCTPGFGDPELFSTISSLSLRSVKYFDFLQGVLLCCPNLRVLDIQNAYVAPAIFSIDGPLHKDARLSHLIVTRSCHIPKNTFLSSLTDHPALGDSLEVLGFGGNWCRGPWFEAGTSERMHIMALLNNPPRKLRSLDLKHASMEVRDVPLLRKLSTKLTELGPPSNLKIPDVEDVVLGNWYNLSSETTHLQADETATLNPTLATMTNAVEISDLRRAIDSVSRKDGENDGGPSIRHLDLRFINADFDDLRRSVLLGPQSLPLKTIDLPYTIGAKSEDFSNICVAVGWKLHSEGSRYWIERNG
ncbi:uncharacterized protein PAC_17873 [Phialocephala subalpina]|uniref:F-box domain-containing protein n=1 Tax=Phialocephala subalpina TaxID=576137 RepID=A0A1L7XSF3_9HELO|nr:uncharacterized protein PAC_17873 [Phialocephala subalpina]